MTPSRTPPEFRNVALRGSFYRGQFAQEIAKELSSHSHVLLERDPHNPYDRWAIKCLVDLGVLGSIHFAFVGREWACQIAPWMDQGWIFLCTIKKHYGRWQIADIVPILPEEATNTTDEKVKSDA